MWSSTVTVNAAALSHCTITVKVITRLSMLVIIPQGTLGVGNVTAFCIQR